MKKILLAVAIITTFLFPADPVFAQKTGRETGFAIPRFVSLKASKVNLRVGPEKKYAVQWVYKKSGLPVEIIQEFNQWMRIRDSEGTEGWVLHSLLSGKRTAIVAPWDKGVGPKQTDRFSKLYNSNSQDSAVLAKLQPGVIVKVKECDKNWCEVSVKGVSGYMKQPQLWGAYP